MPHLVDPSQVVLLPTWVIMVYSVCLAFTGIMMNVAITMSWVEKFRVWWIRRKWKRAV